MWKVVLIGDSIRMGYQEHVRQALADIAEVWAPRENGGTSDNVLAHLEEWVLGRRPDLVHINCGLHDIRREFGATQNCIPLDRYEANLRTLFRRVVSEARGRLIWATTTPVNEQRHHAVKGFDRFEADVVAYNEASRRVAREMGVPVLDLYQVVMEAGRDRLLEPDGVHFTPEGYAQLGQAVAACIRTHLMRTAD